MNQRTNLPLVDPRNTRSCLGFIAALPITNPAAVQELLPEFLGAMYQTPPSPAGYLEVLEMLRAPLAFAQSEVSRSYASKPLPPTGPENEAFMRVVALWKAMSRAYAQIAQIGGSDETVQADLAKICQRCLHYSGQVLLEHHRARRAFAPGLWMELHGFYDTAEEWGLAMATVPEPLGAVTRTTTCAHTYAAVLLADLANPYGRNACEFAWIQLWAHRFASLTRIVPPPEEEGCRGYGVDLMLDHGLRPVELLGATPTARVFDTAALGPQIQQLLSQLKQGVPAPSLGLGDDCRNPQASRLLLQLYRPWCLAAVPRRFERFRSSGTLSAAFGVRSAYYYVHGNEFVQPEHVRMFSRSEMESLWTFRNQLDPTQPLHQRAAQLGYQLEQWEIADSSLNGFRLKRGAAGGRVTHGDLACLKVPGRESLQLARISWLMLLPEGGLQAGLQLIAGEPQAVRVRPMGTGVSPSERYLPAFVLPAVPSLKEPASILVPHGWFYAGRLIEMFTDRQIPLRLTELLDQGTEFERVAYAPA